MNIFRALRNKMQQSKRKNSKASGADILYKLDNLEITVPSDHALPVYQSQWRLYDKFLPFVVRILGDDGVIIDVGANVGDTAIAMAQHCKNTIISIEPDEKYYQYLVSNVSHAKLCEQIYTANVAIGEEGKYISLTRCRGTAKPTKADSDSGIKLTSLNEILKKTKLTEKRIRLIKCDTDGFDYQVLASAIELIKIYKPILYWENAIETTEHLCASNALIRRLDGLGYSNFACFDNFGSILYYGRDIEILENLNEYLLFQYRARQIIVYYYDILIWVADDAEGVNACIKNYKEFSTLLGNSSGK